LCIEVSEKLANYINHCSEAAILDNLSQLTRHISNAPPVHHKIYLDDKVITLIYMGSVERISGVNMEGM
jgi:hypothetical protein